MGKVHWYGPPYEYIVDLILDDGQHKYFFSPGGKPPFNCMFYPPSPPPSKFGIMTDKASPP